MTIREELTGMVNHAKSFSASVNEKSNLYTDLGFDSLSFIRFLLEIEGTYSITFDIMEMELCLQVDHLIATVEHKVKEKAEHDQTHIAE